MKKLLAFVLASLLTLSMTACGSKISSEQQLIIDAVKAEIQSEDFADWQELYESFTTETAAAPVVTDVTRYQIPDFEGVKMDCYLVTVSAGMAHWINEAEEMGTIDEKLFLFVDAASKKSYDSISTDAANVSHDTTTELGRATYLLWIHANLDDGSYSGSYLNDSETVTTLSADDLKVINDNLQ